MYIILRSIYLFAVTINSVYASKVQRFSYELTMRIVTDVGNEMIPIGVNLHSENKLHCARSCREHDNCYSFNFNKRTKLCTLGSWLLNRTITLDTDSMIYTQGAICDEGKRFKYISYQNVSACIWISDEELDYTTARKTCGGMNSNLYTIKVIEKLYMMMDAVRVKHPASVTTDMSYWVGLHNILAVDVYRWEDDGEIFDMSTAYKQQIFCPGEPDNPQSQRCILYSSKYWHPLNDYECGDRDYFICEKLPFFP